MPRHRRLTQTLLRQCPHLCGIMGCDAWFPIRRVGCSTSGAPQGPPSGLRVAAHPENPPAFPDGYGRRPSEHLRITLLHTPRTEIVKGGAAGIRHEDFRDTHGDAVAHELIQGVHEFLPKADVRPHDEIERGELQGHEVHKGALPGGDGHPVALGMQLELGKHRRIGVQPSDLRLEHFGAGDADQPPAAAEFQHAGLRGHTALLEIV